MLWEALRALLQAEQPGGHHSITVLLGLELRFKQGMGLGLQPRWVGDWDPSEPGIAKQMDPGVQTKGVWGCNQPKQVQNCNPGGSAFAVSWLWGCNPVGLGL